MCNLTHHHPHSVIKEHLIADVRSRVYLNACEKAGHVGNKTPQPLEAMVPAPMRTAVQDDGVQAGVTGQHLPRAAGSGVAVKNALNIGTKA